MSEPELWSARPATGSDWEPGEDVDEYFVVNAEGNPIWGENGVCSREHAELIVVAVNGLDKLEEQLKQADAAWQVSEAFRVAVCEALGVDYTLEGTDVSAHAEVLRLKADLIDSTLRVSQLQSMLDRLGQTYGGKV